jgi:medium-chain acyl-[acyl-carrier-protein] hydrolase
MEQDTDPRRGSVATSHPAAPAPLQLFCFPYAGGSSRLYADWDSALPPHIRVRPVEPPGRGRRFREAPHDRIEPLVADLLPELADARNSPYALFGYSLGALVAFELARTMEQRYGRPPEHLCVGAFRAPHLRRTAVPDYDLPEPLFRERLRSFNGTPEAVLADESLMELMIPILRADLAVADTYRFSEDRPLSCPITAFAGSEDGEVDVSSVAQWRRHTSAGFALKVIEGDHFFLHERQPEMLRYLSEVLTGDGPRTPPG